MPSTEQVSTQVANLALAACGVSKPLVDMNLDRGLAGQMCRLFYDLARQSAIRDFPWPWATKQVNPALVANQPTPEWLYAYQYPADALKITRFMSWRLSNDTRQSRVPYTLMQPVPITLSTISPQPTTPYSETTGMWIYTNWPSMNVAVGLPVIMEYIFDNTNVAQWTSDFIEAFALKLATMIVTTLTTGDPYGMQAKLIQLYTQKLSESSAMALNEEQRPQEPQSEFIRARAGDIGGIPGSSYVSEPAGFVIY